MNKKRVIIFSLLVIFLFSLLSYQVILSKSFNNIGVLELIDKSEDQDEINSEVSGPDNYRGKGYVNTQVKHLSSSYISKYIYSNLVNKLDDKKVKYFSIDSHKNYDLNDKNDIVKFCKKNKLDLFIKGYFLEADYVVSNVGDSYASVNSANCNIKLKISFIDNNGNKLVTFYPESDNSESIINSNSSSNSKDIYKSPIVQNCLNSIFKQIYNKLNEYL
jgi:hypothetical protein